MIIGKRYLSLPCNFGICLRRRLRLQLIASTGSIQFLSSSTARSHRSLNICSSYIDCRRICTT
uniref:Putative ovule protein n=1 Tax=Solanum chacoense TaxID=4108 RepID=A0A0V0H3Q2_SOLCH